MKRSLPCVFACLGLLIGTASSQSPNSRVAPENANEARLNRLQPPEKVMDIIGAAAGMTIAEIGAGGGRYVVHLAARVGPEGKIYAEDIDGDALRHLAERCRRVGFANVETVLGDPADPKLPAGKLDLIFVISSYHHFDDPVALMDKARAALSRPAAWPSPSGSPTRTGREPGRRRRRCGRRCKAPGSTSSASTSRSKPTICISTSSVPGRSDSRACGRGPKGACRSGRRGCRRPSPFRGPPSLRTGP